VRPPCVPVRHVRLSARHVLRSPRPAPRPARPVRTRPRGSPTCVSVALCLGRLA
jgi:hypothetical protein